MAQKVASILAEIGVDSSKFTAGAGSAGSSVSSLISTIGGLNPVLIGLGGAFSMIAAYMGEAEKAAVESNIVQAKQEAILKATGYAANLAASELNNMAASLSQLTGIDDEAIVSAQSLMLTFRNIGRDEFPRAMQAAADLQTTFGSLESSSMQLGKALNDPVKGITALARAGVTFSEEQKKQIQGFVDTNQLASAQAIILSEVEKQVGGTAAAVEKAGDGSNRLNVSYENLAEAIGQSLIPAQRGWNNALADAYDAITKNVEASSKFDQAARQAMEELSGTTSLLQQNSFYYAANKDEIDRMSYEILRADEYGQAWERTLRAQGVEFEGNTSKIQTHTAAMQADEEAMTKANEATLKGVEQWQSMEESFTNKLDGLYSRRSGMEIELAKLRAQGYWEQGDQIQGVLGKMAEVDAAIQNEKMQYDIKTKSVVLGYIEQKLAADGVLDDKETLWLLQKGVEWGIYKQTVIDAYRTAAAEAANYAASVSAIPMIPVVPGAQRVTPRAAGGPASGLTLVGENGPEIINLPGGSFVNNNQASRGMVGGNTSDNSGAIIAALNRMANELRIDYGRMARANRDAFMQAG